MVRIAKVHPLVPRKSKPCLVFHGWRDVYDMIDEVTGLSVISGTFLDCWCQYLFSCPRISWTYHRTYYFATGGHALGIGWSLDNWSKRFTFCGRKWRSDWQQGSWILWLSGVHSLCALPLLTTADEASSWSCVQVRPSLDVHSMQCLIQIQVSWEAYTPWKRQVYKWSVL